MTEQSAAGLVARLHRLADQLGELRERVRVAVATEAGRAVGEAVRDLVTAVVRGRIPVTTAGPFPTVGPRPGHPWGDDPDDWDRDDENDSGPYPAGPAAPPRPPAGTDTESG